MRKRKSYLFTDKKNSNRAVMAVILGAISLIALGAAVFISYSADGEAGGRLGAAVLLSAVYSATGLGLSVVTVQDKNCFRLFPVTGIILNGAALTVVGMILRMGNM